MKQYGLKLTLFLLQETLRMHAQFHFYISYYIQVACCSLLIYSSWLSPPIVCAYQAPESLAAHLTSDAVVVMESSLDIWSRGWSITLSLFRLLEKLLIYKTVKS